MKKDAVKYIVVIGAGYGGLTAALRLEKLFRRTVEFQIHLVDRCPYHTLKTQLHEAAVHKRGPSIVQQFMRLETTRLR